MLESNCEILKEEVLKRQSVIGGFYVILKGQSSRYLLGPEVKHRHDMCVPMDLETALDIVGRLNNKEIEGWVYE